MPIHSVEALSRVVVIRIYFRVCLIREPRTDAAELLLLSEPERHLQSGWYWRQQGVWSYNGATLCLCANHI